MDIVLRHALEPDRLPDAALRRVPDAVRVQRLLAARELGLIRCVAHAHEDRVFLGQHLGDVHRERQVAARVRGQLHAVAPHGRGLVDRAEVQQHAADVEPVRQRDRADVPQVFFRLQDVSHTGQLALGREGHEDRAVGLRRLLRARRDRVAPRAVEIQVAVAHHLRPGILRQGLRAVERIRPGCQHNVASFCRRRRRQSICYLFYRIFPRLLSPAGRFFRLAGPEGRKTRPICTKCCKVSGNVGFVSIFAGSLIFKLVQFDVFPPFLVDEIRLVC